VGVLSLTTPNSTCKTNTTWTPISSFRLLLSDSWAESSFDQYKIYRRIVEGVNSDPFPFSGTALVTFSLDAQPQTDSTSEGQTHCSPIEAVTRDWFLLGGTPKRNSYGESHAPYPKYFLNASVCWLGRFVLCTACKPMPHRPCLRHALPRPTMTMSMVAVPSSLFDGFCDLSPL
jgi:hypothetical protein